MKKLVRKTRRLVVRPYELKDYGAWKAAYGSLPKPKNIWDMRAKPEPALLKAKFAKVVRGQIKRRKNDQFYDLAIFEKSTGALVGGVGLMEVARGISHTCFLGYFIFNTHWGQGYAKEAVRAGLDIGFRELKLHRIEAGIEPKNPRSIALAKSLGMRREGLKKRALFLNGKWVDLLMYTLTTEDVGIKFDAKVFRPRS